MAYNQISFLSVYKDKHLKRNSLALLMLFLSACSTVNTSETQNTLAQQNAETYAAVQNDSLSEEETARVERLKEENVPSLYLSGDLLYEILVADLAYKQGEYENAYEGMMDVAKKTRDPRLAKRAAEIAAREKNSYDALKAVRFWHELAPNSSEAKKYLMGFLVLEDRWGELESFLSETLAKADPVERNALMYQYQQFLSNSKDPERAFKMMERLAMPYMHVSETHVALSQMAFSNKDIERAEKEAKEALRLKPDSELAVLTLAQAQKDPNQSIPTLTEFVKQYPNFREVRISLGRLLIGQNKYDEARAHFEYALTTQPDDMMTLYSLGLLAVQQEDYQTAEKHLKRYLELAKKTGKDEAESYQAIFLLAQLAEEQKNYKVAKTWLDKISEEDDREAWLLAQIKKNQILVKRGYIKKARKNLSTLRAEYPIEEEKIFLAEAQILRSVNLNKEVYNLLKTGSKKLNTSINLLYDYSLAAETMGRYDEMELALRRILEIDSNSHLAYNALGYSLADRNIRLEEAYVLISKALELAPEDPYIIDSMGWVLFRQGKFKEAELMLRRAYELLPEAEVMSHLGEVLWFSGQFDEAKTFFIKAKKTDPQNETFIKTIKRLNIRLP